MIKSERHQHPPSLLHAYTVRALHKRHLRGPVPYSTENEVLQSLVSEVGATIMNKEVMERWERKKSGTFFVLGREAELEMQWWKVMV